MRYLLMWLLLTIAVCHAASWDGNYGDLNVFTVSYDPRGLPGCPPDFRPSTELFLESSDPKVWWFIVIVTYIDSAGSVQTLVTSGIEYGGYDALVYLPGITEEQITGLTITEVPGNSTIQVM